MYLEATLTSLDELLRLIDADTEILLMNGDTPLARLSPVEIQAESPKQRIPGLHAGTTWVRDDFDDPLPDEFWLGEL